MSAQTQQIRSEVDLDNHPSITRSVLIKLEQAFAMGCTDKEACLFAGTTLTTFYDYQRNNEKFAKVKEILKANPVLKARQRVVTEVATDTKAAQWYLERKCRNEFGPQMEINVNKYSALSIEQKKDRLEELAEMLGYKRLDAPTSDDVMDAEIVEE